MSQTVTATTADQEALELDRYHPQSDGPSEPPVTAQSLPPVDGGPAAWRLVFAAFVFEALLWGFPLSFGVFQNYYSQLPQFRNHPYIGAIGSIASGISYLGAPVVVPLTKRYSQYRKHMVLVGWPICLLALVAGSFAETLGTLIFTQGVMYGVGFITFYYPILSMVNEFWVSRLGMVYGLLCSASGVSGAIFPFALEAMLQRWGYQITLRAVAMGLFVLTGPLIPFLKGRLPAAEASISGPTDWSFLKVPTFWIYSISNFAMGLGYFFPALYLPSYATANGFSPLLGSLLLAVMSVSQTLGQLTFGRLSDSERIPIEALAGTAAVVGAIIVLACWGLSHTIPVMVVFALIYGFFAAGYTALWGRMASAITSEPTTAFTAFAMLNLGKGIGNVLAGPIGGSLLETNVRPLTYGVEKFRIIILFTGSCMLFSAAALGLRYLRRPGPSGVSR